MDSFTALADRTRREIVELVGERELSAGEISARFRMSAPAISQHLKVLRDARLLRVRAAGQRRLYSLDADGLGEVEAFVSRVRRFWRGRLDDLARELAAEEKRDSDGSKR
jgi:DNA-binding transcriptional ArsR family regulator